MSFVCMLTSHAVNTCERSEAHVLMLQIETAETHQPEGRTTRSKSRQRQLQQAPAAQPGSGSSATTTVAGCSSSGSAAASMEPQLPQQLASPSIGATAATAAAMGGPAGRTPAAVVFIKQESEVWDLAGDTEASDASASPAAAAVDANVSTAVLPAGAKLQEAATAQQMKIQLVQLMQHSLQSLLSAEQYQGLMVKLMRFFTPKRQAAVNSQQLWCNYALAQAAVGSRELDDVLDALHMLLES